MLHQIRSRLKGDRDLEVSADGQWLVFRCVLTDEKELNIAAGKIHRKLGGAGKWTLQDAMLTLRLPAGSNSYQMRDIRVAFDAMVT